MLQLPTESHRDLICMETAVMVVTGSCMRWRLLFLIRYRIMHLAQSECSPDNGAHMFTAFSNQLYHSYPDQHVRLLQQQLPTVL